MANHVSHAALPFPVKGARYTLAVPFLDADGDPTDPTTPDTERSIDGAAFADCAEEVTTVSTGYGYITLTGDEMNCSLLIVNFKSASGPKFTPVIIYPRTLPSLEASTATAGSSNSITLAASALKTNYQGCIVMTTGGTGGGGGSGSQGNQARLIIGYDPSTRVASVSPDWETAPDNTTGYAILGGTFVSGVGLDSIAPGAFADDAIDSDSIASSAVTEIQSGLATAASLATVAGYLDTEIAAILADTNELQTDWADGGRLDLILDARASQASVNTIDDFLDTEIAAILEDTGTTLPAQISALNNISAADVNAQVVDVLRTDTIPDSYAADGAQPTFAQAVLAILQFLTEKEVSGTTVTVNKPDGTTSAMTFTLDDGTTPTSITRAT